MRICCHLAKYDGELRPSKEIAEAEMIPRDYLIQIAQDLREAGLIKSRAGRFGGFLLARRGDDISVSDVLRAVASETGNRQISNPLMMVVEEDMWSAIEKLTLSDLLKKLEVKGRS